jgi:hypothetical protein
MSLLHAERESNSSLNIEALTIRLSRHDDAEELRTAHEAAHASKIDHSSAPSQSSISMRNHQDVRNQQRSNMPSSNLHAKIEPNNHDLITHHPLHQSSAAPPPHSPIRLPTAIPPTKGAAIPTPPNRRTRRPPNQLIYTPTYLSNRTYPCTQPVISTFIMDLASLFTPPQRRLQRTKTNTRQRDRLQGRRHLDCSFLESIHLSTNQATNQSIHQSLDYHISYPQLKLACSVTLSIWMCVSRSLPSFFLSFSIQTNGRIARGWGGGGDQATGPEKLEEEGREGKGGKDNERGTMCEVCGRMQAGD